MASQMYCGTVTAERGEIVRVQGSEKSHRAKEETVFWPSGAFAESPRQRESRPAWSELARSTWPL